MLEGFFTKKSTATYSTPPAPREIEKKLTPEEEESNRREVLAEIARWKKSKAPPVVDRELEELPV